MSSGSEAEGRDWTDPAWDGWHGSVTAAGARTEPPWPGWVEGFRQHQLDAVEEIVDAYDRGKRIVVLDAPVGAGKTLIAEMVRRRLGTDMLFVPHSKSLQEQFERDYPYAQVLKGRANYPVELATAYPWPEFSADDCTAKGDVGCVMCSGPGACPYKVARARAKGAHVAVVNTAYMLREAQAMGAVCSGREFAVIDECDTLEGVVLGAVEFTVSKRAVENMGISPAPKKGSHLETIAKWLEGEWLPAAMEEVRGLTRAIAAGGSDKVRADAGKKRKRLHQTIAQARRAIAGIRSEDESQRWVRDYDYRDKMALILKPVTVDWACEKMVWQHAEKWLLMSGTVIDARVMMEGLGVADGDWQLVTVPMTFPRERRWTRVVPCGDMSRKGSEEDKERVFAAIQTILATHPEANTVIHTVSYPLTREVVEVVEAWERNKPRDGRVWWYGKASERDWAIEEFRDKGGVLIGPSVDRGVDLPGDLCRVQVMVKVPYPSLGDKRIAERLRSQGGQRWYATETARTLVQMTGRGVRGEWDECVAYMLDSKFLQWYGRDGKALLPKWWRDAMKMERVEEYV